MSAPTHTDRFRFTRKEIKRYHKDSETWKVAHERLKSDCWLWERYIEKANCLFEVIRKLDIAVYDASYSQEAPFFDQNDLDEIPKLFSSWLESSTILIRNIERLENEYGQVEGAEILRTNVQRAKNILTEDDVYFQDPSFENILNEALQQEKAGTVESADVKHWEED